MACAACSRRLLSTTIQSIPAFSTRARGPQRFAPPKAPQSWIKSPALFSTQSTLRIARDADPEAANHASTPRDAKPSHEIDASLPTNPEPNAEPALDELQNDLGLSNERDDSIDGKLFKLTGRRPGTAKPPEAPVRSKEDEDVYHQKEDIIAKLVTGQIQEEEANARLAQLEPQTQKPKASKRTRETPKEARPVKGKGAKSREQSIQQRGKGGDKSAKRGEDKPYWRIQKEALEKKFEGASWRPAKRVSPDAVLGIRELHKSDPTAFNIEILSDRFKISKEAVRRILKSKFQPSDEEMTDKRKRWEKRGENVWKKLSDTGVRPPKKWREMGVSHGPAPWKKGISGRRPKEAGYAWDEESSERPKGSSFVGRIE
ncbi:hypothetical protein IWX90DRAFT_165130 [Phyllosticta citrichinensis]|uniref:Required for respiratory growth protein 9, mitochondrial n=1 Tax=Phyllosticta citrichinensis TaxID=1130410 RepID=A0ABR1Y0L2_9PEZI